MISFLIGIDPGVNTGYCKYDPASKKIKEIKSSNIIECFEKIKNLVNNGCLIKLTIEDANKIKMYNSKSGSRSQGAGSVKRDCKIWIEFCEFYKIEYELIHPMRSFKKLDSETFSKITGYSERTNQHGRDAAMLVWGK